MFCWIRTGDVSHQRIWLSLLLLLRFNLFFSAVVFELWYESVSAIRLCRFAFIPPFIHDIHSFWPEGGPHSCPPAPSACWPSPDEWDVKSLFLQVDFYYIRPICWPRPSGFPFRFSQVWERWSFLRRSTGGKLLALQITVGFFTHKLLRFVLKPLAIL